VISTRRLAAAWITMASAVAALALASPATAQSRVEIAAGASWTGGFDAGGQDALLTRNPATGSSPLPLFETSSSVHAAPGVTVGLGFYVTSHLALEAFADYSRPLLRTAISNDFEAATGTTVDSRLTTLVAGGTARWQFGAARLAPFVVGGAGWTRQLDGDNVMLVTGPEVHGGGGVSYRLDRHFALRGQGGVSVRDKTIAFEEKRRALVAGGGSLVYRF
jgi:Outer membrane protein beta-barrel domain